MDLLSVAVFAVLAAVQALGLLLTKEQKAGMSRLLAAPLRALAGWLTALAGRGTTGHLPPRPWGLPVIGNMVQLGLKTNPYECMTDLSRRFGAVYGLRLGGTEAVVVNDMASIREVLVTKGDHFDGRPNFLRYHQLFGGDRDNSLALCDWSKKQVSRRNVARFFMHVRPGTDVFQMLNDSILSELTSVEKMLRETRGRPMAFKPFIQTVSCNIFSDYLCSFKFDMHDPEYQKLVRNFDEIFWDINQGYAMDFIEWLKIFRMGALRNLQQLSSSIRQFINDRIVSHHKKTIDYDSPRDFVDMLLRRMNTQEGEHEQISETTALYELEDFLGGHSAVGNIIMQTITQIARNPDVMVKIQEELDERIGDRQLCLEDRPSLPYTESTMYEALRVCSSPIVPHVASRDSTIGGYDVHQGAIVFINNYELNMSPQLWSEPEKFNPARFVRNGVMVKPSHFLPFSTGKRSCMGSKMLANIAFLTVGTILSKFDVLLPEDPENMRMVEEHMRPGCLALPVDSFKIAFRERASA
ncbi:cytochrome P450 307a1-like [Pollicipes pollicipes]|uniref:cytochrome P450 307a1-like n=1 Tax=Pollicipes pollicipes TaxID=41117 RepID=UPI00188575A8|nr:cytochrome P450 307a1-like [Pollicipes pollicipes]